jgi:hypothetical protein
MRWVRALVATAAAASALAAPSGAAAATFTDTVAGFETRFVEVGPGLEVSTFVGAATGELPGYFRAIVTHTPLAPGGAILDDGADRDFRLVDRARRIRVIGEFTGGTVNPVSAAPGCGRQVFDVDADLTVQRGVSPGTGHLDVTLTHFRTVVFGRCVTYFATVKGTAVFQF